jgi:2-phosphosulfolactate phosphatase
VTVRWCTVDLDGAQPGGAVVVIDVLRAFTFEAWAFERGTARILAVDDADCALRVARGLTPPALAAGERGGRPLEGFDLGNSPLALADHDVTGRTLVHRTSAGTQGLARTAGSELVLAASLVTASATARYLLEADVDEVTFVVTGRSLGRDGDEDLVCAELIAALLTGDGDGDGVGDGPDPAALLARVARSDAGRMFAPEGPDWAPPEDLRLACEVDRFGFALVAEPEGTPGVVEVRPHPMPSPRRMPEPVHGTDVG